MWIKINGNEWNCDEWLKSHYSKLELSVVLCGMYGCGCGVCGWEGNYLATLRPWLLNFSIPYQPEIVTFTSRVIYDKLGCSNLDLTAACIHSIAMTQSKLNEDQLIGLHLHLLNLPVKLNTFPMVLWYHVWKISNVCENANQQHICWSMCAI